MNLFNHYLKEIKKKLSKQSDFKKLINSKTLKNIVLEKPPENFNFDLSTNIALVISKDSSTNPREIAEKIRKSLLKEFKDFSEVEIAGPGFLNINLSKKAWLKNINYFFKNRKSFGSNNSKYKYNVEFVSANPTGPMHVGHCRGAVFGDVISNLLI